MDPPFPRLIHPAWRYLDTDTQVPHTLDRKTRYPLVKAPALSWKSLPRVVRGRSYSEMQAQLRSVPRNQAWTSAGGVGIQYGPPFRCGNNSIFCLTTTQCTQIRIPVFTKPNRITNCNHFSRRHRTAASLSLPHHTKCSTQLPLTLRFARTVNATKQPYRPGPRLGFASPRRRSA
jgi:hypothetical protein